MTTSDVTPSALAWRATCGVLNIKGISCFDPTVKFEESIAKVIDTAIADAVTEERDRCARLAHAYASYLLLDKNNVAGAQALDEIGTRIRKTPVA